MIRELMDGLPLWSVMLLTVLAVLVAIEVGYRAGRWRARLQEFDSEALLSAMTGAHLALLAFIMAFSFSMASGHHSDRKKLILEEANGVTTAYLRSQLLPSPYDANIGELLREYAAIRASIHSSEGAEIVISRSEESHRKLWQQVELLTQDSGVDELEALLITSLNEVFDIHEKRVAAGLRNRIPPSLWASLLILLTLSMAGIGYFSGMKGHRNPIASTGLALSFSLVMFMIADLDRPSGGLVQADHSIMKALDQRLNAPD